MIEEQEIKAELIKRKIIEGMDLTDNEFNFCDMNKQFFKNIKFIRTKKTGENMGKINIARKVDSKCLRECREKIRS